MPAAYITTEEEDHPLDYDGFKDESRLLFQARSRTAAPLFREEVDARTKPDRFKARGMAARLRSLRRNPWKGFFEIAQSLR